MPRLPIAKGLDNILLILMQVLTLFQGSVSQDKTVLDLK